MSESGIIAAIVEKRPPAICAIEHVIVQFA